MVREIGLKLRGSISKGNENWFEKSGVKLQGSISEGSENWLEKSRVKYSDANPRRTSLIWIKISGGTEGPRVQEIGILLYYSWFQRCV